MEKLYGEIGKKIKLAAYVTFIVEAIIAVIEGLATPFILVNTVDDSLFIFIMGLPLGVIVAALGVMIAWVSSWLLYGFGELIDKTCDIEKNTSDIRRNIIGIKNDTCDIEKNTRNGQSKMQIDENINTAEAEAKKNAAEKKAAEIAKVVESAKIKSENDSTKTERITTAKADISIKEMASSVFGDNNQDKGDFTESVSKQFVTEIIAADEGESDWESRYYLKMALKYLKNPAELEIIGALLKLPEGELQDKLKELRKRLKNNVIR